MSPGYSRLMEADEGGTLRRLKALRAEVIDPKIDGHRGRLVKTTGDGLLVEFASVVDVLRCAARCRRQWLNATPRYHSTSGSSSASASRSVTSWSRTATSS